MSILHLLQRALWAISWPIRRLVREISDNFFDPYAFARTPFELAHGFMRVWDTWWYQFFHGIVVPRLAIGFAEALKYFGANPSAWWFYYVYNFLGALAGFYIHLIPVTFFFWPLTARADIYYLFREHMVRDAWPQYLMIIGRHYKESLQMVSSGHIFMAAASFAACYPIFHEMFLFVCQNIVQPIGELFYDPNANNIGAGFYGLIPEYWKSSGQAALTSANAEYYELTATSTKQNYTFGSAGGYTIVNEYTIKDTVKEAFIKEGLLERELPPLKVFSEETAFSTPLQGEYKPSSVVWPLLVKQIGVYLAMITFYLILGTACASYAQYVPPEEAALINDATRPFAEYIFDPSSPLGYIHPNDIVSDVSSSTSSSSGYTSDSSSCSSSISSDSFSSSSGSTSSSAS